MKMYVVEVRLRKETDADLVIRVQVASPTLTKVIPLAWEEISEKVYNNWGMFKDGWIKRVTIVERR